MPEQFRIGRFFLDKRPNSPNWCVCWFDPEARQTRRASLGTSDLQVAKVGLAEYVTKNESLKDAKPGEVPLEAILIRYYEQHAKHIRSAEQARISLGIWSDHFAGATVSELTPKRQEAFVAFLQAKGFKPSYVSRILSVGRAALTRAWKRGELASQIFVADVERNFEAEAERFRNLERDEVTRLLVAASQTPHLFTFCIIALNTLARPDAVLDLGPGQVDLRRRLIALNPKGREQTKKYRPVVPISATLLPWVQSCDGARFVTHFGRPVASIKKSFAKAACSAGLPGVTPYSLRHTMATEMRAGDVPEWEVKGMLGHSADRTTERYAKYRPDYLGKAVAAIDAYFDDLRAEFSRELSCVFSARVRASSVLVPSLGFPEALDFMVGATGIEPVTPAMSTQCSYR
jgi:integrase